MRIIIINYNSPQGFTVFKALSNTNPNRLAPRLSIIAATLLSLTNTAIAQENGLEEIIVKGEKIDRTIQDTVSSVAVFSSTQIEESAIYDIQEVFDRLANVNSAEGNEGFSIRGISDRAVGGSNGTSGLASFNLDGAFISRRGVESGQKELWDVSQIEVFRGPQSTTQGRNSLAGAIFIRTNDPTYEPEGQYRVAFGTDNTRALSVAYGDALIEDQLAFRIAIDDQSTDGFITNEVLDDDEAGEDSSTTIRAKLLFEPAAIDGLSILTTLSHSENESTDFFSSLIDENGEEIDPFSNRVFANIDSIDDVDQTIFTTEVNYEISDQWSFTSISSYNETEFTRLDDDDQQAFGGDALRAREEDTDIFSQEFRLTFESERLTGNVGLYYFQQDGQEDTDDLIGVNNIQTTIATAVPAALAPFAQTIASLYDDTLFVSRAGVATQEIENYAVFGNLEYEVNDLITVFGGVRYDNEEVENFEDISNGLNSTLPDPADVVAATGIPLLGVAVEGVNGLVEDFTQSTDLLDNDTDFSAFLPKLGITFNWNDNLSTSFTVQRAYRAGGSGTTSGGNFEFDPEFTTNYDLALRSQWFDNRLTVNTNLFYIDWEDQQVTVTDTREGVLSNQELITLNSGESTASGVELEVNLVASDSLDLYGSLGYVDAQFDNFLIPEELIGTDDDLSGNAFNNAPEITASIGAAYDVTSKLRIQADINYQDESFDDAENTSENDSRTLVNSKITYQINDAFEVALVGSNIFDQEYLIQNDEFNNDTVIVGQPRTVLVQLQGKF